MTKGEKTQQDIKETIQSRLNKLGPIQAKDAWKLCKTKEYSHSTIIVVFKKIMVEMAINDLAEKVSRNVWWIYRQSKQNAKKETRL